jgi:hypothetical protein
MKNYITFAMSYAQHTLGTRTAESADNARDMAYADFEGGPGLCWQCAEKWEIGDAEVHAMAMDDPDDCTESGDEEIARNKEKERIVAIILGYTSIHGRERRSLIQLIEEEHDR